MKITRFARLVIVVMVTLGVLFGGVIGLHRAAENPEACILFEGTEQTRHHNWLLDTTTGARAPFGKSARFPTEGGDYYEIGSFGSKDIYTLKTGLQRWQGKIYREPTDLRGRGVEVLIQQNVDYFDRSPDGTGFAYTWKSANRQAHLTLVNGADGVQHSIQVPDHERIVGDYPWSPNGKYFVLGRTVSSGKDAASLTFYSMPDLRLVYASPAKGSTSDHVWSPDGKRFAYLWRDNSGIWLTIVLVDEAREITFARSNITGNGVLRWSPDSRHVLFQYILTPTVYFDLFGVDGSKRLKFVDIPFPEGPTDFNYSFWADDSKGLFFYRENRTRDLEFRGELIKLDLTNWQYTPVLRGLVGMPRRFGSQPFLVATREQGSGAAIDILDIATTDDSKVVTVVKDAVRETSERFIGLPWIGYFHPVQDGVMLTWQTGTDSQRRTHLKAFRADGSVIYQLSDEPSAIMNLRLLNDGRLAYLAERGDGYSVEVFDPATNTTQRLVTRSTREFITGWNVGLSPDETIIYVTFGLTGRYSLALMANQEGQERTDHKERTLYSDLAGNPRLAWSEDSSKFVVRRTIENGKSALAVFNRDGSLVKEFGDVPIYAILEAWRRC
jgi:Tol biopolymer transport system component